MKSHFAIYLSLNSDYIPWVWSNCWSLSSSSALKIDQVGLPAVHHFRPGATGGIPWPCPPKWLLVPPKRKLCPPKRGLCPEDIDRLGATGLQIEAQIGVCDRYFCNFVGLTPDFMTFLGWRPFFYLEITRFRPEKPLKFPISAGKSLTISVKTFFFWNHLFSAGKSLWIFGLHLVHLIQTGINFSCPRAPLKFT